MNCAISGVLPTEPVVTKDGILYEKRLILKMITENKSCPVTGNELSEKDLIPITSFAGFSKPKAPSEASVPNILLNLQNEWDSVMLETFELKKQYQELQTQLSNCLYENDAAKRVIARLLKERDEARKSLVEFKASYKPSAPTHEAKAMEEDESPLPAEIQDKMDQVYKKLFESRKSKKNVQAVDLEAINKFTEKSCSQICTAKAPSTTCLDVTKDITLVGGEDGSLNAIDNVSLKVISTVKGHKKPVTDVKWVNDELFLSGSVDQSVKLWKLENQKSGLKAKNQYTVDRKGELSSICVHPSKEYFCTADKSGYWDFCEISNGKVIASQTRDIGYTCADMHPDGLIYGLGQENGVVQIYDLKTQQMAFKVSHFSDPVTGIKFSENGYHMVVYSTDAGVVNFYDLRKVTETEDVFYSMNVPQVNKVKFDKSGKYVGISTLESIRMFHVKKWDLVWEKEINGLIDFDFGFSCEFISVGLNDRKVSIFSI